MKYAYQRDGAPILNWNRAAPQSSRAADARALGSLGGTVFSSGPRGSLSGTVFQSAALGCVTELPRAGAPEPLGADVPQPVPATGVMDKIMALSTPVKLAAAVGLFFAYKKLKK